MAIAFDGASKIIALDSASTSAAIIWSRWVDWHASNPQWPLAFRQSGGDPVGGGIYSPTYFFMLNGWRVRPMESDHDLAISGNLAVDGGGTPVVRTIGPYQVNVAYIVPERAQGIATSGSTGPTKEEIAAEVLAVLNANAIPVDIAKVNGTTVTGSGTTIDPWSP